MAPPTPGGSSRALKRSDQTMTHGQGESFSPTHQVTHHYHRKTTKFKGQLNSLKVNYIVCLIQSNERYESEAIHRSKVGVIHEQDLLYLDDRVIEYILSVVT
jgi:hypothetical protein